jgi:thiamine kinase
MSEVMIPDSVLARIPGCEQGQPPMAIQILPGGRGCNSVLRVDTRDGRFVLRHRHLPLDRPGSVARMELVAHTVAARAGFAPRLIDAAPDGSWMLMPYVEDELWTEARLLSNEGVETLGERLAQVHALPLPQGLPAWDGLAVARQYLQQQPQCAALLLRVEELVSAINGLTCGAVLNHGDLQHGNLLGPGPMLLDWEYAQLADPTYDIACLLTYYPRMERQLERLLASAGLASLGDRAVLRLQQELFAAINRLWETVNTPKAG